MGRPLTTEEMAMIATGELTLEQAEHGGSTAPAITDDGYELTVTATNKPSVFQVRFIFAGQELHRDQFDIEQAWKREKFRETVRERWNGLCWERAWDGAPGDSPLTWIDAQILEKAAEATGGCEANVEKRVAREAVIVRMSDVEPEPITWLWRNRIPRRKVTNIIGDPGLGKGFLLCDLISRTTNGTKCPDCPERFPRGGAVILTAEDELGDTIRPRLDAAGADVSKIVAVKAVRFRDKDGDYERQLDLARDLDIVEQAINGVPNCCFVGIDPISAYLPSTDSHSNSEVRQVMAMLKELAERTNVAIVTITHLRKGDGSAIYRSMGSLAFVAAARAAWAVTRDRDDPRGTRRLFLPVKNNLGPDQTGLAFSLADRNGDGGTPHLLWEEGDITTTADEAMQPAKTRHGPEPAEREEAEAFLLDALEHGPRPVKDIEEEAVQTRGITKRTLERARKTTKVEAFRETIPGPWLLRLPNTANPF